MAYGSTRLVIDVDTEIGPKDVKKHHVTVSSFSDLEEALAPIFKSLVGENTVVFPYLDCDETILMSILPPQRLDGRLDILRFLACPDLGRTYKEITKAAATYLHRQFSEQRDFSTAEESLLLSHRLWRDDAYCGTPETVKDMILSITLEITRDLRQRYQCLEGPALKGFLECGVLAKEAVRVCSGLTYSNLKAQGLEEIFGDETDLPSYMYPEGGIYLYSGSSGKAGRIETDIRARLSDSVHKNVTVVLVDNSQSVLDRFVESFSDTTLDIDTLRIITVHYTHFETLLTPETLSADFLMHIRNLEIIDQLPDDTSGTDTDTDSYDDFAIAGLCLSDSSDSDEEGSGAARRTTPEDAHVVNLDTSSDKGD